MLAFAQDKNARMNKEELSKLEPCLRCEHQSSSFAEFYCEIKNTKMKFIYLDPTIIRNFVYTMLFSGLQLATSAESLNNFLFQWY
jgi:hypothetical protein